MVASDLSDAFLTMARFREFTGSINLLLSARPQTPEALLRLVIGNAQVDYREVLLEAIRFLQRGYGDKRRKNGLRALIHPIRTARIASWATPEPTALALLGALLHDVVEDFPEMVADPVELQALQGELERLKERVDQDTRWYLGERMAYLTHVPGQSYVDYLVRLLDKAADRPDLLHCKLADRLDSTGDIELEQITTQPPDFFDLVYHTLFLPGGPLPYGVSGIAFQPRSRVLLLSQLFKNTVLMSLLRASGLDRRDRPTARLFDSLGQLSRCQAGCCVTDLFLRELGDATARRELLLESMTWSAAGGVSGLTAPSARSRLDGMFVALFDRADDRGRKDQLAEMAGEPALLARLLVAFVTTFSCFLTDPGFTIQGITPSGFRAVASLCA